VTQVLKAQPGPQEAFLSCSADIAIYGGAAGGGKSFALLLDPLRGVHDEHYRAVFFRRSVPNLTNEGGLWQEARAMYEPLGGAPRLAAPMRVTWPSGASFTFTHLQHERTKLDHKGGQYTWVGFDELTEFEESQFWYLLSRARSPGSGFRPCMRATTNPDAASWVRGLIDWWIGEDGLAVPGRSGVVRWMRRAGDAIEWHDEEVEGSLSFTFIAATVDDNPALLAKNPEYKIFLMAQSRVERERLLGGNWDVSFVRGMFADHRIRCVRPDEVPEGLAIKRYWDLANTEVSSRNPDPDWTAGVLGGLHVDEDEGETLYLYDCAARRVSGAAKRTWMRAVAEADELERGDVEIGIEREGGATGSEAADDYVTTHLAGYHVTIDNPTGDKVARAARWLGLAERGRVVVVGDASGQWPEWWPAYKADLEAFPHGKRDRVDATSGLYKLCKTAPIWFL